MRIAVGPDAKRYLLAGKGEPVAKPFHLRWLLPWACKDNVRRWLVLWVGSWIVLAVNMAAWAESRGLDGWHILTAAALVLGLPGVLGHPAVRPVGVDLPAMAFTVAAAVQWHDVPALAVVFLVFAAACRETSPVWLALWLWNPWPLVVLVVPGLAALIRKPGMDPVTASEPMRTVHDHPIRSALQAHEGRWRDAWLMVAPWGVCLVALARPTVPLIAVLIVAYAQLLVATDSVRLFQTAAGPPMALAAAALIPTPLLLPAVVVHTFWWRRPEMI